MAVVSRAESASIYLHCLHRFAGLARSHNRAYGNAAFLADRSVAEKSRREAASRLIKWSPRGPRAPVSHIFTVRSLAPVHFMIVLMLEARPSSCDSAASPQRAAVAIERGDAGQRSDLASAETSQFRQFGNQGRAILRPMPGTLIRRSTASRQAGRIVSSPSSRRSASTPIAVLRCWAWSSSRGCC